MWTGGAWSTCGSSLKLNKLSLQSKPNTYIWLNGRLRKIDNFYLHFIHHSWFTLLLVGWPRSWSWASTCSTSEEAEQALSSWHVSWFFALSTVLGVPTVEWIKRVGRFARSAYLPAWIVWVWSANDRWAETCRFEESFRLATSPTRAELDFFFLFLGLLLLHLLGRLLTHEHLLGLTTATHFNFCIL